MIPKVKKPWYYGIGPILSSRKHLQFLTLAGSVGLCAYHILPHTLLKEEWRKFCEVERDSKKVTVGPQMRALLQRAVTDLNFSDDEKSLVDVYVTQKTHPEHFGSVFTHFGLSVGIPETFQYSTVEEAGLDCIVSTSEILYPELPRVLCQYTNEELLPLKSSFVLSGKAKLYAIACELVRSKDCDFVFNAIAACFCFIQTSVLAYALDVKYFTNKVVLWLRCPCFCIVGCMGYVLWALLHDYNAYANEENADAKLCQLGESYIEGGVEYWEKVLLRNKLLRSMLGSVRGETIFCENGDFSGYRTSHVPFSKRLAFIRGKLKNPQVNQS